MGVKDIEKRAKEILDEYSFNEIPVDPVKIASKLGIPVKEVQFKDILSDTISGGIKKEVNYIQIYVNKFDHINRKRFTIAHELGHYFLGHLENKGEYVDLHRDIQGGRTEEEKEAHAFAAAILMDKDTVNAGYKILRKAGFSNEAIVIELAELFIVSPSAMKIRLKSLGLA